MSAAQTHRPRTVAHVTDTHFGGPPAAQERNERVLAHLLSLDPAPDVLVITGDVADHGTPEEYAASRAVWAAWPGPMVVAPGNHDVRGPFSRAWCDGRDGPLDQVLDAPGLRLLVLDSLVPAAPGKRIDHGELAPQSLAWLDDQLASSDVASFVCLHHPPVTIGLELMDPIRLRDPEGLEAVLRRHPHVVAVLVGHAHSACATTFAGLPVLVGSAVASTVTLAAEQEPTIWTGAPPGFALHLLVEGRLVTHWRMLP